MYPSVPFISKKKYLNQALVERDKRLLKSFYLDKGFYDVNISSSTVDYFDDKTFKLSYRINAGPKYTVNLTTLELPQDYDKENFDKVEKILKKLENKSYSFSRISKVVNEIDKYGVNKIIKIFQSKIIKYD